MSIKNNHLKLKEQDARSSLRDSSGQALIETILLLVVGIALALILMNSFFGSSLKSWGENQFGSYLQCLLESGELPALGGGAGACSNEYVAFGEGAGDGSGGPGSGGGGSGDSTEGDGSNGDGGGRAGAPGRVAVDGNRAGRGRRGSARRFAASSNFGSGSGAGGEGGGAAGKKESQYSGSSEVGLPSWATQGGGERTEIKRRKVGYRDYDGFYSADQKKQKEEGDAVTVSEEKVNSQDAQAPQAMLMKKRAPTSAPPPDDDDEWTFGGFIKYIIIIAIIIGIILFLGSQLLQIKNSMD